MRVFFAAKRNPEGPVNHRGFLLWNVGDSTREDNSSSYQRLEAIKHREGRYG
nr:MAG TPA: hypothetical protein [Caudoviricetes sp.]